MHFPFLQFTSLPGRIFWKAWSGLKGLASGVAFVMLTGLSGCQTVSEATAQNGDEVALGNAPDESVYMVSTPFTSFYSLGPQQPSGPDLRLRQDDLVVLVKKSFGYSQVSLEDGQTGWVATSDIKQAPPEMLMSNFDDLIEIESTAIVSSSNSGGSARSGRSGRGGGVSSAAVVETIESSPLTEEALPEGAPLERPAFRY